jgi:hypothetical protein
MPDLSAFAEAESVIRDDFIRSVLKTAKNKLEVVRRLERKGCP